MKTYTRGAVLGAAVALAAGLVACGGTDEPAASGDDALAIGVMFPQNGSGRNEQFDRPLIEQHIGELCEDCTVEHANAQGDPVTQQRQADAMITRGVDVLIVDAVDSRALRSSVARADEAGIPVVAYDRLVEGPISAFVSFSGEEVGRIQAEALLEAMGHTAEPGQIVMMNGDMADPNARAFRDGALTVFEGLEDRVTIGRSYDTPGWRADDAYAQMVGAIAALGADNIDGVLAANDRLASAVISALKAARVDTLPPVTGQDAELDGVQRVITGEQTMSVYKPFTAEAEVAAEMALALGRGEEIGEIATDRVNTPTTEDVPAALLEPIALTVDNIEDTVVRDGMYTMDQICTPRLRSACEEAGLIG